MAGTDELIYRVRLEVDDNSYEETKRQLKELHDLQNESSTGEAMEGTKEFTEVMEAFNKSNAEGIERLIELQEAIDSYTATLGELRQAKKSEEGISREQQEQEVRVAAALKDSRQEYRDYQKELIANTNATRSGNLTYNQMTAELKLLRAELQNIPLNDTTGKLDKQREAVRLLNEDLKSFDKSLGDNRRNVGNYSEALSVGASAVAAFQGPLGPIAGRMTAINSAISRTIPLLRGLVRQLGRVKVALIGTGVGAAIVAIGTLIAMLTTVQTATDAVSKKWQQMGAVVSAVTTTWLRFIGATDESSRSMREAWEVAGELFDASVALEEQQIKNVVTQAKLEVAIAKARREAEDEINTLRERSAFIQEAIRDTHALMDSKIEEAKEAQRIAEEEAENSENKREDNMALAEAEAEVIRLQAEKENSLRQLQRRSTSLTNQMRIEAEQRAREIQQIRNQIEALRELNIAKAREAMQTESENLQKQRTDRRIDLLRQEGLLAEAEELRMHQKRLEAEREFSKMRLDIEENTRKKAIELAKLYMMEEGMSLQEATNRAIEESKQAHAERIGELEQALADKVTAIHEDYQANLEDLDMERVQRQDNILEQVGALREERLMAQEALERATRGEGHEELILLEMQQHARMLELQAEYYEEFEDMEVAHRLASEQSELEFYKQKEQTKSDLLRRELESRLDMEEGYADIAIGLMTAGFGDIKAIRVATAIIDTYTAANRQLATTDGPLAFVRAGAVIATGLANIRTILDTKIGSTGTGSSGASAGGSTSAPLGFEVIDRTVDEGAIARQVAEGSKQDQQEVNPTFIFTGDLDPEVMSIKVRQGDRMINTKTITTQSV